MANIDVLRQFLDYLGGLDYKSANGLYAKDVIFSDPLYGLLQQDAVRYRTEMICKNIKVDVFAIENFHKEDNEYCTASWKITYVLKSSGLVVTMKVKSFVRVIGDKIAEHSDAYKLSTFIGERYGIVGRLFGWTGIMQRRVRKIFQKQLQSYMNQKQLFPESGEKRNHDYDFADR